MKNYIILKNDANAAKNNETINNDNFKTQFKNPTLFSFKFLWCMFNIFFQCRMKLRYLLTK